MRCWVATGSAERRSSERKRAYARSVAGEPASTPMKFESCPPAESAPLSTGRLPSGAVSSSWTWNLLSLVFMVLHFLLWLTSRKYSRLAAFLQLALGPIRRGTSLPKAHTQPAAGLDVYPARVN